MLKSFSLAAIFAVPCLMSTFAFAAAGNLLDFDLSKQGPFLRQVRGWKAEKSEGDWLGYKWAFGAWDANCLFEMKLAQDADGIKYLSFVNLEGQPSLMFFRNEFASASQGDTIVATFAYRTTGEANGLFVFTIGKQEEKFLLPPTTVWKSVRFAVKAKEDGALAANWRNLALGADRCLHLKDLAVVKEVNPFPSPSAARTRVFDNLQSLQTVQDPYYRSLLYEEFNGKANGMFLCGRSEKETLNAFRLVTLNGTSGNVERVAIFGQRFTEALRITSGACKEFWHVFVRADAPPTAKGDTLWMTVWARAVETGGEKGVIQVCVKHATEITGDPAGVFPEGLSNQQLWLTPEWKQYCFPMTAKHDDVTRIEIYVAQQPQTVEIGGVAFLTFGAAMTRDQLPQPRKSMTYPGREPDAAWRKAALARIELIRKAGLTVQVIDATGKPVPNAEVKVTMTRQAFWFGSAIPSHEFPPNPETTWGNCRSLFTAPDARGERYRAAVQQFFNSATAGGGWRVWEFNKQEQTEHIVALRNAGIDRIKLHVLLYPRDDQVPDRLLAVKDPQKCRDEHFAFVRDQVTALKGKVQCYDVVNELNNSKFMESRFPKESDFLDYLADLFKLARSCDPSAMLYYNECDYAGPGWKRFAYLIAQLQARHAPVDGIGIQGHAGAFEGGPEATVALFDKVAQFGTKLMITEFDAKVAESKSIEGDILAADATRDMLIASFSHPAMEGFITWGFWDGDHWLGDAPFLRKDWSLKPSGNVWKDLVCNQWWTRATLTSGTDGTCGTRGFLGDYVVSVAGAGKTGKVSVTLPTGGATVRVVLK